MRLLFVASLLASVVPAQVHGQHLTLYPAGPLRLYHANPNRGYQDLVVGTVALVNPTDTPLTVEQVEISARAGDTTLVVVHVDPAELGRATGEQVAMRAGGAAALAELGYPLATLGGGITFSDTAPLGPRRAVMLPATYLAVRGLATSVRVVAIVRPGNGERRRVELAIPVAAGWTRNEYRVPLDGAWLLRSVPGVTSHHRFNAATEFAVDFWKVDSAGAIHQGEGRAPDQFYGFGAPIRAAADGVVESTENEVPQDWGERVRRAGETNDQYRQRLMRFNIRTIAENPRRGLIGNYVVIRHPNGEWSVYGHLKMGSVRVRPGDSVRAGQQIAEVGDTGDSHLVHLHFQVNVGPDPLVARTVPLRFPGASDSNPDLGIFVRAPEPPGDR